ncbi:MAG: hypothetical protein HY875_16240 [Chloroflexi bacterium]|nr:hypothetical protein [Chloroflexota bacterium]
MAGIGTVTRLDQDSVVDNTNHDLIHTLSVRLDAQWHNRSYAGEVACQGCRHVFERLREMDREAAMLLTKELELHVQANKFPQDLTD